MIQELKATAGHDIAFAHGRIAVLQQLLLSGSDVDRLLGAHDTKELAKIFIELRFTSRIDQGEADPDAVLTAIARWVRDEVLSMAPPRSLAAFDVLWLEGDIPLLAYLLKKKIGLTSAISQEPSPAFTSYDISAWKDLIEHGRGWDKHHPQSASDVVAKVLTLDNPTPAIIDTIAAEWGAKEQMHAAKLSGSSNIIRYVRHSIDLQNIRTALRSLDRSKEERQQLLITGGTIRVSNFLGVRSDIAHAAEMADLGFSVAREIRKDDLDIQRLEQALSSVIATDIAVMWN